MRRLGSGSRRVAGARTRAMVTSAALALALAGCGGGSEPSATDGSAEGGSASPSPTPSVSVSLPESQPMPEPATGPRLEVAGVSVHAPKGWLFSDDTVFIDSAISTKGRVLLSVAATDGKVLSVKQAQRYFWTDGKPPGFREQDTVTMGGMTAGYYTARDAQDDQHVVTVWDGGYAVQVRMAFARDKVAPDRQREILASVVASYATDF